MSFLSWENNWLNWNIALPMRNHNSHIPKKGVFFDFNVKSLIFKKSCKIESPPSIQTCCLTSTFTFSLEHTCFLFICFNSLMICLLEVVYLELQLSSSHPINLLYSLWQYSLNLWFSQTLTCFHYALHFIFAVVIIFSLLTWSHSH